LRRWDGTGEDNRAIEACLECVEGIGEPAAGEVPELLARMSKGRDEGDAIKSEDEDQRTTT
jgi:hypothetical protein